MKRRVRGRRRSGDGPTDEDLWEDAFEDLLPGLYGYALIVTADPDIAEDLVADACLRALPHLRRGEVIDLRLYLRRSISNAAMSEFRRRQVERRHRHHGPSTLARDSPARGEQGVDLRLSMLPRLLELTPLQRAVVYLRYVADLPVEEVAELLSMSEGSVKSHSSRGRAKLRQILEEEDRADGRGRKR